MARIGNLAAMYDMRGQSSGHAPAAPLHASAASFSLLSASFLRLVALSSLQGWYCVEEVSHETESQKYKKNV